MEPDNSSNEFNVSDVLDHQNRPVISSVIHLNSMVKVPDDDHVASTQESTGCLVVEKEHSMFDSNRPLETSTLTEVSDGFPKAPLPSNDGYSSPMSDSEDMRSQEMVETASGSKFWCPNVDVKLRPKVGDFFQTVDLAERMYRDYADEAGFKVRLSNRKIDGEGRITSRFFVCSNQGMPPNKYFDSLDVLPGNPKQRNSNIKRSGCRACLKVHFVKERRRYEIYKFIELHNHILLKQEELYFLRSRRNLDYLDYKTVLHGSNSKMGISKSHRFRNAMKCGIETSRVTPRDYLNLKRDMVSFVGKKDAQMLINKLENRRKVCPNYFVEYKCDGNQLISIFWADETARLNYKEFGDAISFDATYRHNKHAMIFVPFVAVDNHKKSVVVGAALINAENTVNFTWVLQAFLKAHGQQPRFVITDQCAAMKQAIPIAFPDSKHRLCMWHITKKLTSKISSYLAHGTSFTSEFSKLVWDVHQDPHVFEQKWNHMMEIYGLQGDSWFTELYSIRESWIPAYYKDSHMSGLMKTTSRSESINAYFNVYARFTNDLAGFITAFDNAIDEQQNTHGSLEVSTKSTLPRLVSPCKLEAHAAKVYTRTIFFEFQKELRSAVWFCGWEGCIDVGESTVFTITHKNKKSEIKTEYTVVQNKKESTIECSCNGFVRKGILCRHALKVMLNDEFECIPDRYILRRWRRDLIPAAWLPARARYGEIDIEMERLMGIAFSTFERIIGRVRQDKGALSKFVDHIQKCDMDYEIDLPNQSKSQLISSSMEEFYGVSQPESVDILPPTGIRNKGCGTDKRLVGADEKAISKGKKPKRRCRLCLQLTTHDSRNCPKRGASN